MCINDISVGLGRDKVYVPCFYSLVYVRIRNNNNNNNNKTI